MVDKLVFKLIFLSLNFKTYFVIFDCAPLFSLVTLHQNCFDPYLFRTDLSRVARRMILVEQELRTLSEHMNSPRFLVSSGVRVARFVDYCLSFLSFFRLAIALSVLRFMASDYLPLVSSGFFTVLFFFMYKIYIDLLY